ncbi:hypothetical protein [Paenibacillus anseongense]|uniref:hypothetical protein n=1 Tax=Paenibacillus anseongense TaxID=2682845 RepID=UPI002DBADFCC|nr:hypothetical protein [Paenibacillus anseongense]MEC0269423.1 hypothetical protein [Paenibacillus anseongense]
MSVMNTTTNASPLSSGRKVTKLSNGWLVAVVSEGARNHKVLKSTDNGATWSNLTSCIYPFSGTYYLTSISSIASTGTTVLIVGATRHQSNSDGALHAFRFDATTVGSTTNAIGTLNGPPKAMDMVYDSSTNTMHVFASHATGISNNHVALYYWSGDLGTNWTQITVFQLTGQTIDGVAISVNASGHPVMFYNNDQTAHLTMVKATTPRPTASMPQVDFGQLGYVPQPTGPVSFLSMVKNPTNGYMYLVWADPLDAKISAIRSTDGGINWSARTSFGASNTAYQDCQATIDNQGRVVAIWSTKNSTTNAAEIYTAVSAANDITSWSTPTLLDIGNITGGLVSSPVISHDPNSLPATYYYMWRRNNSGTYSDLFVTSNSQPKPPINLLVDGKPITGAYTNNKRPVFNWTFNDSDPGDFQTVFEVAVSRDAFATWYTGSGVTTSGNQYWQCGVDLPDGNVWQIAVRTADSSGVFSDWAGFVNFTIDTTPPVIGGITPPVATRNATQRIAIFGVSNSLSGISHVDAYILNKAENAWQGPFAAINAGGGTWYYDFNVAWEGEGGRHVVDIWVYNNAGSGALAETIVIYDITPPAAPTQTNGILYATSNSVSWSAYYDYGSLAGLLLTTLYLEKWNGSSYVAESGYPKSVAGLSNAFTGLTPATQYRWGVTYTDNAGNVSALAYTNFTTNSYAVTTIENMVSGGKVYNARPKIRLKVIDANDATLTDLEFQRSPIPPFSSPSDVTMSGSPQAFNVAAPFASGSVVTYTPQSDMPTGISYIRARANDGKDWGQWSSVSNLTIETPTYPTTISANDTTISKRTIDDIRAKVNIVRQARGLAVIVWTDSTVKDWTNGAAGTNIRAIHLIELRQAINDIYVALGVTAPTWGIDPIIDTTVKRKGQHWIDLRNAIVEV